jgi:hypothetical protein
MTEPITTALIVGLAVQEYKLWPGSNRYKPAHRRFEDRWFVGAQALRPVQRGFAVTHR